MHVRIARCFTRNYCTRSDNHLRSRDLLKLVEKEDVLSLQAVREQQTKVDYQALLEHALGKNKPQSVAWLLKTKEPILYMQLLEQVAEDCSLKCIKAVLEYGLVDMNSFMEAVFKRADKEIINYILSFYGNPKLVVRKLIENDKVELLPYYLDEYALWDWRVNDMLFVPFYATSFGHESIVLLYHQRRPLDFLTKRKLVVYAYEQNQPHLGRKLLLDEKFNQGQLCNLLQGVIPSHE